MTSVFLEVSGIRKEYPGTVALQDATVRFDGGSIHALVGKNGAGKSTLVKIITGAVLPTAGSLVLNGERITLRGPSDAQRFGITAVYQELSLIPHLSVAENILLGRLPLTGAGLVDWTAVYRTAREVLDGLGLSLDVHLPVSRLSVAHQQLVEIAKAMSHHPSVLLLDEPTSALAPAETDRLFALLRDLAARGVALIYITHRMHELARIADRVTILRDGIVIGTIGIREATPSTLVSMMFGENVATGRRVPSLPKRAPVLVVRSLRHPPAVQDVSFTLHRGEILGIAGVLGAGRTELLKALFGAERPASGEVEIRGQLVHPFSPEQMKALGLALAPENRKEEGLVQLMSVRANMVLASLSRIARHGFTTARREREIVRQRVQEVDITTATVDAPVSSLSGGNQQKVVLGKWLTTQPDVLLLDEPTRGIDVRAKQQVFDIIRALSTRGIASLVVSSELEELLDICHRILIMRHGRITNEVDGDTATLDQIFTLCMQ
jgi:ABC-type sugar transport system ATPase subunit